MSGGIVHMCLSVRGALCWPKRRLAKLMRRPNGSYATADESREALLDWLAEGWEVLPLGDACEGFDPKKGCPGHPSKAPR